MSSLIRCLYKFSHQLAAADLVDVESSEYGSDPLSLQPPALQTTAKCKCATCDLLVSQTHTHAHTHTQPPTLWLMSVVLLLGFIRFVGLQVFCTVGDLYHLTGTQTLRTHRT